MSSDFNDLKKETGNVIKGWFLFFTKSLLTGIVKLLKEIFSQNTIRLFPQYAVLSLFLIGCIFVSGLLGILTIIGGAAVFSFPSVDYGGHIFGILMFSFWGAGAGVLLNLPFFPVTFILLFILNRFHVSRLLHIFFVWGWCSVMPFIWGEEDMVIIFAISGFFLSLFSITKIRLVGESLGLFEKEKIGE